MKKQGFTLIEILIVVAIIGILASIILVGLGSFRARGRDARRIADLREVQNALELYYTKNQQYPDASDWNGLQSILINGGIGVSAIPNDPLSGRNYGYCKTSDNYNYVIAAYLEDINNPVLTQASSDATFPCDPNLVGTPNPSCSKKGSPTNKYCLTF
jgi:prepilin-type N-terminal cleavage/methylation domain-containing protein